MTPLLEQSRSITQILRALGESEDKDARARRKFTRRAVNVRVVLEEDGKSAAEAWALNLSAGGIRIVCEETLAIGELLRLRIDRSDEDASELSGMGRVVWVKKCSDGFVSGIEFIEPM